MSLRHPRCHVLGQPPCCPFASHSAQSGGILRPVDSHGAHGCGGHVLGSLCHQVLCVRSPLWIRICRPLWRNASCHTLPLRCYQRYPHNRFPQVRTANSELNEMWLWLLAAFVRAAELAYGHAGFSQTRRSKAENVLMMVDAFASPFRSISMSRAHLRMQILGDSTGSAASHYRRWQQGGTCGTISQVSAPISTCKDSQPVLPRLSGETSSSPWTIVSCCSCCCLSPRRVVALTCPCLMNQMRVLCQCPCPCCHSLPWPCLWPCLCLDPSLSPSPSPSPSPCYGG